jgi:microcystin-dependent protein
LGEKGGNSNITLSTDQLPSHSHTGTTSNAGSHSHTASDSGHFHSYDDAFFAENTGGQNVYGTGASTDNDNDYQYRPTPTTSTDYANITVSNDGQHTHTFTTDATGINSSINIMNPYLVLNYLIKY